MKRNASMTLRARTAYPDGARENMGYTVRGTLEETAEGLRFTYDEPGGSDMGAVRTAVTLGEGCVLLSRAGAVRSTFRFAEGEPHDSLYETGPGSFPARVTTHALRVKRERRGALAEVRYTLELGGASGEHRLKLLIREEDAE